MPIHEAIPVVLPVCAARPRFSGRTFSACFRLLTWFLISTAVAAPSCGAAPADSTPLDEPLRMIVEARKVFQKVADYSCVLIKRERINGQMTPDDVINLKVRNQPFSVSMQWQAPSDAAGREVCYVAGRRNDKLRVHPSGALSVVGWLTIDPRDPRA